VADEQTSRRAWGTIPYAEARSAILSALEPLRGLRLSVVARAADMLSLGFGELRMMEDRERSEYALHVQAPWRLDHLETGTITGRADVWDFVEEKAPDDWHWDEGPNLRDHLLERLFPPVPGKRRGENHGDDFRVRKVEATAGGDVLLRFGGPYELRILPEFTRGEAWRIFRPADRRSHFVFKDGRAGFQ
jgi:hypothetical protein